MGYKDAQINEAVYNIFYVYDTAGDPVTGLVDENFTKYLYDPSGSEISSTTTFSITEMGQGLYKSVFIPDSLGLYVLYINHATYLPTGVYGEVEVNEDRTLFLRILGLVQENIYIDNYVWDGTNLTSARMRIYSDPDSVSTTDDVIGTYTITCTYNANSTPSSFKVVKSD